MLVFNDPKYLELARSRHDEYVAAEPFPHVMIDQFLPDDVCRRVLEEFPRSTDIDWLRFNDQTGRKLATRDPGQFGETVLRLLQEFNGAGFVQFLEALTGIEGLIPDPYYEGGGLHQIQPGGFLKVHADFNRHRKLGLDRRINALLYLNRDWQEEYGGHLELWDRSMTRAVRRILPVYNRLVVFNTTDWAYHGHPEPLACPAGMTRKSLALYYYTAGRPAEEVSESHTTLYQHRPEERARTRSLGHRARRWTATALEKTASLAQKPASLLRIIAERVRPPEY
jgi:2OG-Fe(II) oxygenase superfamily